VTALYESLKTLCERRRSVRSFDPRDVSPGDIEKIKAIAYTSPYASGRRNWELMAVTDREKIGEIAGLVRARVEQLEMRVREDLRESFSGYAVNFTAFESAPVLIIPTFRISPGLSVMLSSAPNVFRAGGDMDMDIDIDIVQWERDNYVKSISCAAMLVLLAAESLGLGGCYMTGPLIAEKEIAKLIHVKKGRSIGAIIPIGRPAAREPEGE
jgi:nitroreductase